MAQTRLSFSEIGIHFSTDPKRYILRYPVLWILNPQTGRCKRYDHFELKDEINKKNYRGLAETAESILIITDSRYYSFSSADGSLIKSVSSDSIRGQIIGVQETGVLFRDGNKLSLIGKDLTEVASRELTQEEIKQLDD